MQQCISAATRQARISAVRKLTLQASTSLLLSLTPLSPAAAACILSASPGNDTVVCDSGTAVGNLVDTLGNNTLLFPAGGTGQITGNVTYGAGADRIEMHSGTITGTVDQGDGPDAFIISAGTVIGNVQQGGGIDDFQMTGGQIGSLNQGDARDTFFMSAGRIVDFFDDGDYAGMTGGRIGRVNMKLDKNYFNMSGGVIDRNLVTGFDDDTIIVSGGTIGGNISTSGGNDSVTVTGGSIGGDVLMSFGQDTFTWSNGGIIYGTIDLGGDNDTATLSNLNNGNLGATKAISGGLGVDTLTLSNVSMTNIARLQNWETINATDDTQLVFDGTLTLGDTGTGTGTLTVDAASTLYGGGAKGGVSPFTAGQLANVINAGRIDLTNGGNSLTDTFTVAGNYTGNNGLLLLQTALGDDASASDKLVISGGRASGETSITVVNVGGAGAATAQNGIMVVQAVNGGTTAGNAFALNGPVAAGAYEYFLFRGGVTAGSAENWYLRSTLVNTPTGEPPSTVAPGPGVVDPAPPPPQPIAPEPEPPAPPPVTPPPPVPPEATPANPNPVDPAPPVQPTDAAPATPPPPPAVPPAEPPPPPPDVSTEVAPLPSPGATPPSPGATPVIGDVVPLYRLEVPTYAVLPPAGYYLMSTTLGTFHERRGKQSLLGGVGMVPASWGRLFGQDAEVGWGGTVSPTFDGHLLGFQAGTDLIGWEGPSGHENRAGLFIGHTRMEGDIRGQALGWNNLSVGKMDMGGTSFGAYWTHIGPGGWYLDGVAMGTWFNGKATSNRDVGIDVDGTGVTLSLEGGYPIPLDEEWSLEPQAQLIWQHLSLDGKADRFSSVSFDNDDSFTGRLGLRLQGTMPAGSAVLQPYLKANLWHDFGGTDQLDFGADPISAERGGTSLELGGGVVAKLSDTLSVFATADYTTNLGGDKRRVWEGNLGLSVKW